MPKKPPTKEKQPPQRRLVYAGPPGLGEVLRKLNPPRLPELDRSALTLDQPAPPAPRKQEPEQPLAGTMAAVEAGDGAVLAGQVERKPAVRREGARRLSQDQIDQAQAYYEQKLDDPNEDRRWLTQQTAAKHITVKFLRLPEGSWQTIEDEIVIPVLERRGLRKPKK